MIGCLLLSFIFTGIEAGLLALNPVRVRHYVRMRSHSASSLEQLLEHPEKLLLTVVIVTNLANTIALLLLVTLFIEQWGLAGYVGALAVALPLWSLGLGVIPKALFRRFPFRTVSQFVRILGWVSLVLAPVLFLLERLFVPLLSARSEHSRGADAEREEIKFLAAEGERSGELSASERSMIASVIDFRDLHASQLMVPWEKVTWVERDANLRSVIQRAKGADLDRLPILDEAGRVVGLVQVFDVLLDPMAGARKVGDYLRHAVFCRPNDSAFRVARRLRAARVTLGVVTQEDGAPVGIVTLEELLDRMVQTAAS